MNYKIKLDYLSDWGSDVDEDTVISEEELNRLSDEWDVPVEKLLKELIPID